MTEVFDKIINKIKEKNIHPKPKWEFILKNILCWVFVLILIVFGAISFSVIMHMFVGNDWDLQTRVSGNFFEFLFKTAPHFWLIILSVFLIMLYIDFKSTKRGYKLKFFKILSIGIGGVVILGVIFYIFGVGKRLDSNFINRSSIYKTLSCQNADMWNNPKAGVLVGKFLELKGDDGLFQDVKGKNWNISFKDMNVSNGLNVLGANLKLIGEMKEGNNFYVSSIRQMRCGCQMENCNCGKSERNFLNKRSNNCGL